MKRMFAVTLGVLTAVGGFVDIGDLVASSAAGARFGLGLAWALLAGLVGIMVFTDMAGRVAAISGRAAFDLIRERLGPRVGMANLVGSALVNFMALAAEIGGVALAVELLSGVNYLFWLVPAGFIVWYVIWHVGFESMERIFGLLGLLLLVIVVTVVHMHPDWSGLAHQVVHPAKPDQESYPMYLYWAVALFASAMTPYEVFFFSSGGVEEGWSKQDLAEERTNVLVGFPLGCVLALGLMVMTSLAFMSRGIQVESLSQVAAPVAAQLGQAGLATAILAFGACTFGAALETGLSSGYAIAQYFGWPWGKRHEPREAARFHLVVLVSVIAAVVVGVSSIDPIKITEYSLIFSAVALPLTYLPILLIANDRDYMGDQVNGRLRNIVGTLTLLLVMVAAVVAIPLMILTKGGG